MRTNTQPSVTVNAEQGLYVIPCGGGYTCLGFQVCEDRQSDLADEMNMTRTIHAPGTIEHYNEYVRLNDEARSRSFRTGWKSATGLTSQLIGLEGKRIEVVDCYGETRRFYVGKSTGWIPCHLQIARRDSTGGPAVMGAPFKSVKVVGSR